MPFETFDYFLPFNGLCFRVKFLSGVNQCDHTMLFPKCDRHRTKVHPPHARTPPPWGDSGAMNLAWLSLTPPKSLVPWAVSCKGHLGSLAVQVGWERLLVKVFKFRCRFLPDHTRHIYMYRLSWSNCGNSKTEKQCFNFFCRSQKAYLKLICTPGKKKIVFSKEKKKESSLIFCLAPLKPSQENTSVSKN